ncbi:PH domain containing protein [Nitzschia inconspicua]|uniref:PH domain containing protein n=1 Tax=Nitzschia inconspicua TaxID=303405 RepID=A0A9K3M5S9_9STRA|nr:PH domain containing protein [Nitzschia inconspicua]
MDIKSGFSSNLHLKAAPALFQLRDDNTTTATDGSFPSLGIHAEGDNSRDEGGLNRIISKSYGGDSSPFLSGMMRATPPPTSMQRYNSAGTGTVNIKYSGYLYKRSNYPHQNPNSEPLCQNDVGNNSSLYNYQSQNSSYAIEIDNERQRYFVDASGMPNLPPMPGGLSNPTLNESDDDQLPVFSWHDFRSPQSSDEIQQQKHTNPSSAAFVTPSPVTNSSNNTTITSPMNRLPEQEKTNTLKRKEEMNPLQMAAAFFGMKIGDDLGQKGENQTQDECIETAIPDPPILTSTIHTKRSSSSIQIEQSTIASSQIVQPSAGRAIPIPNTAATDAPHNPTISSDRESFYEANHRRHSAPTETTQTCDEDASSELLESSLSFGPKNCKLAPRVVPQDFYDPKDGHLWRAKYCVLEDGVLYFYRNANDGDSVEAAAERREAHNEESRASSESPTNSNAFPSYIPIPPSKSISTLSRRKSSAKDLSQSPMVRPMLHHLDSSECRGSDTMWEKRVFLDCIEEVRTAEHQFGKNSFELTAVSDEDNHVDRLVLKAPNLHEMNEWIFQFHRSLALLMRNIMDVFGTTSSSGAFLDIHGPASMLSPLSSSHHTPLRMAGSIPHSPSEKQLQRLMAMSPRFHHQIYGSGSAAIQTTLSHGHGRTSLRRRTDLKRTSSEGTSVSSTPEAADEDSPQHHFAFREPSPSSNLHGTPETISPLL